MKKGKYENERNDFYGNYYSGYHFGSDSVCQYAEKQIVSNGITALIYVISYVFYKAVEAETDAVENAYKRKKENEKPKSLENLADRYKNRCGILRKN